MKNDRKIHICNLCGKPYTGSGNNPWPLCAKEDRESRCCDWCNMTKVIPAKRGHRQEIDDYKKRTNVYEQR